MHRSAVSRVAQHGVSALAELPPPYLAPSLHFSKSRAPIQTSSFSTTSAVAARRGRDMNRTRGVSAIHGTGPRFNLSASKYPLPKPVSRDQMKARPSTPNHGLWGFFPPTHEALSTTEYDAAFGRPWSVQELRNKSWDDLHKLWWVCVKERNRIATSNLERSRLKAGFGDHEANQRDDAIVVTQKTIKHVLRERFYAWEDASRLYAKGYRPQDQDSMEEAALEEMTPAEDPFTEGSVKETKL
ncbi:54S ribosomal protein L4, mitochondrial [Penicillium ucsense]|uniref:Large ribosomal subunit protein uL29m n=1 Tax=Penicillium ucsense TaxID=2839758 RepID=A0A8J8WFA4_9EURO|nr:54S ribosomal protein L4, mitochondrial [Penicillium ucsense]KAF7729596.1 54S ribosomal protein L4, mitochondrial [Penicillium ucsense]